jgi:hypothetical protein
MSRSAKEYQGFHPKHEIYFTCRHSVTAVTMQLARMGTTLCCVVAIIWSYRLEKYDRIERIPPSALCVMFLSSTRTTIGHSTRCEYRIKI